MFLQNKNLFKGALIVGGILLESVLGNNIASAQDYSIHGNVKKLGRTSGDPIENVRVDVDSSSYITKTDAQGNFSLNVPVGNHNVRFSTNNYKGFFKQDLNLSSDTTLNASMPSNMQESNKDSIELRMDQYNELNQNNQEYPNSLTWNFNNGLIPVYLKNASSNDSLQFRTAIGACDGNWQHSPAGSVEFEQKKSLYILTSGEFRDPITKVPQRGTLINFNAGSTNTILLDVEENPAYIRSAEINLRTNGIETIQKEVFGRIMEKGNVGSRSSYMNTMSAGVDSVDHMLNMVFFNYWDAIWRGEQHLTMYEMEDSPVFATPSTSIITSPSNNSANIPLETIVSWSNSFGTDVYHLQIARDSEFNDLVVDDSSIYRINTKVLLPDTSKDYFARVKCKNTSGASSWSNTTNFKTGTRTDVARDVENRILSYSLAQNYPNPFNPSTTISYSMSKQSNITLKIYDVLGRNIAVLVNDNKPAGNHKITWNAKDLSSGVYFYKLQVDGLQQTKIMVIQK